MRGILINPYTKSINEVPWNGSLAHMYSLMSWLDHRVSVVEIAGYLRGDDALYVDEEGLFKSNKRYFNINGKSFVGCALVLGVTRTGSNKAATLSLTELQTHVTFTGASHV